MKKNITERLEDVPLDKIIVGARRRVDYGDITGLASSMEHVGLQQPIKLTADYVLIFGGRRLKAAQSLGWKTIRAITYSRALSETELRIRELAENKHRKDFEDYEEARTLVELAAETAKELREEAQGSLLAHSGPPDSDRAIVKALNEKGVKVSRASFQRKKKRVEEVERDPSLMDKSQGAALKAASARTNADTVAITDTATVRLGATARKQIADIMKAEGKTIVEAVEASVDYYHTQLTANYPRLNPPSTEIGGIAPTKEQVKRQIEHKGVGVHPEIVRATMPSYPQFQAGDLCSDKGKGAICKITLHPKGHHPECPKFPLAQ